MGHVALSLWRKRNRLQRRRFHNIPATFQPGPENPQLLHLADQSSAFQPKFGGCAFRTASAQPTASSVFTIRARSESLRVVEAGYKVASLGTAVSRGLGNTPRLERITARSIRFCNSRTFPGHEYELRANIVSGGAYVVDLLTHPTAKTLDKMHDQRRNVFMQRARSGSGGEIGNTLRR